MTLSFLKPKTQPPAQDTPQAEAHSKRTLLREAKKHQDAAALSQFFVLGLAGVTLLIQLLLLGAFAKLASKPVPSLVQLSNGATLPVAARPHNSREPETIKRFVADSLILLMSWHNQLPPQRDANGTLMPPGTDPGMTLNVDGKNLKLTSPAYQASYAFEADFREELVKLLATSTPPTVFSGQVQTLLTFQAITEPEELEPGRWQLTVVGQLTHAKVGTAQTRHQPFNRTVTVRAIETPPLPEDGALASPLALAVHSIRQAGLEIESMEALDENFVTAP